MRWKLTGWVVLLLAFSAFARDASDRKLMRPAKVRSGKGVYYPIAETLDKGTRVTVLEEDPKWVKVKTQAGLEGWISSRAFSKRTVSRGFGKVLEEKGLAGVSTTVVTMAARGLSPTGQPGAGTTDSLVQDFLEKVPFEPADLDALVADLGAAPACPLVDGHPVARRQVHGDAQLDDLEHRLGLVVASRMLADAKLSTDPELDAYVNTVGMAVAARSGRYDLPWRFVVFAAESPRVHALPGGLVLLSSGLLRRLSDEAELAAVLGQAIAHVNLGHGAEALGAEPAGEPLPPEEAFQQLAEKTHELVLEPRGTAQELEADSLGALLAACAGYDAPALARAYRKVGDVEEGAGKGPAVEERLVSLEKLARTTRLTRGKSRKAPYARAMAAWQR